eukprot:scaffold412_cov311-Pavlova_lutheri.AAC.30
MLHPLENTMSAASGSPNMLASAAGLTFPLTLYAPPRTTTLCIFRCSSGSIRNASAKLVKGPRQSRCNFSECWSAIRNRKSAALSGMGLPLGWGGWVLPNPSLPCTKSATRWCTVPVSGPSAPLAIGTSSLPAISLSRMAFSVAMGVLRFPNTVVIPSSSTSGDWKAMRMAMASSIPGSVSITSFIFSVAMRRRHVSVLVRSTSPLPLPLRSSGGGGGSGGEFFLSCPSPPPSIDRGRWMWG